MGEFRNWIENWTAIGPKDRAVVLAAANTIRDLADEVERLRGEVDPRKYLTRNAM